jgi:hypothetical protein
MSQEGVKLDPKKIQAIEKWQSLAMAKMIRFFLGLTNSYRKLKKTFQPWPNYSHTSLKKEWPFEWKDEQKVVFDLLKGK